ncbi:MAG: ubiquitin-like domain-containing protein, partial [Chloroflexota bacterium]
MTFVEPPTQPDDTKPNLTLSDTQTISKQRHGIPLWMIVILLLVSGISLFGTINYALSRSTPAETILEPRTIVLRVNGEQEEIQSEASTVDDFLIAENVAVGDNDLVYPERTTPLADNMIITIARARSVIVMINGEAETIQTPFENPSEILTQAQVEISDSDLIFVDGSQASLSDLSNWTVPANEIIIQRTVDVTIIDGDSETILTTTAETVGDALFEAEIDVFLTDTVSPELSVTLTDNMTITIERASPIAIHVDGETIETRVQGTTVLDALAEAGIALVGLDYTIPATDQAITQDTVITVLRVTESIESTDSTIAFETVYQA